MADSPGVQGEPSAVRAPAAPAPAARRWRRARRVVQALVLLLFVTLLVYANAQRPARFWPDLFARLDPLLAITASLAGRALAGGTILAGAVLLSALVLGRAWCGWLCPLGTVLEWLGPRPPFKMRRPAPPETWRAGKVLLLVALLAMALLGSQALVWLDPITILHRAVTAAAWPALRGAVLAVESALYGLPALWPVLDAVHTAMVRPLFLDVQPVYHAGLGVALFLAGLVALNWWAPRFWCRYLCPLGGLLSLLAGPWPGALLRREVDSAGPCTACGRCARVCPTGTIPARGFQSDPAECTVCLDCLAACPREAGAFRWHLPHLRPGPSPDTPAAIGTGVSRRQVLAAAGLGAAAVAGAAVEPITRRSPVTLLRPPGAGQVDFSALCVRCGACVRVCPTSGLQPSLLEGGWQNLLTPRLEPRLGYCSFPCNACGQVCPTGAIPPLGLAEKQATVIGLARIDTDRCLPWAKGQPCIVCEEACPVADKAIKLEEVPGLDAAGQPIILQRPRVVNELCIGCGMCEYQCPLDGQAATRVFALMGAEAVAGFNRRPNIVYF